MKRISSIALFFIIWIGIITIGCRQKEEQKEQTQTNDTARIEIKTFHNDSLGGWGYNIFLDNKLYIHQPHIPAVNGTHAFKTEAAARKTAELMIYKINKNILPPAISVAELDSLGILVN